MPSSHDCEVDVVRPRKRYCGIVGAVACGAFLLILAGTTFALVAANQRAVQAFDFRPRIANNKQPRASSRPASTTAAAAPTQTQPAGSTAAPEAMWDTQESLGEPAHHGRKKNGRRFARWHSHRHGGLVGFFAGR